MSDPPRGRVLIAGVTTRALAISAAKAGYQVTAVDAFGDRDLQAAAQVIVGHTPGGPFRALRAATLGQQVAAEMVAYTSNFENYPYAVARLSEQRMLLGNGADVLRRVRSPFELSRFLHRQGFPAPAVRSTAPSGRLRQQWLLKPRRSGGGHAVRSWRGGVRVPRSMYLQERVRGLSGSLIFAAAGGSAVVLGLSRQLVGISFLGARGAQYCGSLLASAKADLFPRQREVLTRATALATSVTREFHLLGLNGIDFVAREGVPYPIEVNPRYSASMELVERATGTSIFEMHLAACRGALPVSCPPAALTHGKAIVFARRTVTIPEGGLEIRGGAIADIPHPSERIERGRPICTVFAQAETSERCRELLLRKAALVYRSLAQPVRRAS